MGVDGCSIAGTGKTRRYCTADTADIDRRLYSTIHQGKGGRVKRPYQRSRVSSARRPQLLAEYHLASAYHVPHVRSSHSRASRNEDFGFELSSAILLSHCYSRRPLDRSLTVRLYREQGPPSLLCAYLGTLWSKVCELVDRQSSSTYMGARFSRVSIRVDKTIRSCIEVLWLVQCKFYFTLSTQQIESSYFCQLPRFLTTDLQALNFILTAPEFEKTYEGRQFLKEIVGGGWPKFLDLVGI